MRYIDCIERGSLPDKQWGAFCALVFDSSASLCRLPTRGSDRLAQNVGGSSVLLAPAITHLSPNFAPQLASSCCWGVFVSWFGEKMRRRQPIRRERLPLHRERLVQAFDRHTELSPHLFDDLLLGGVLSFELRNFDSELRIHTI
jgi:hypothetical protein